MTRENWDDLRYVLAVFEEGSLSGAARRLGVNHATVQRRIAAFEEATNTVLFDKTARGYVLAAERLSVLQAAREVELAMNGVLRMIEGSRAPLTGEVRITSTDSICTGLLPPVITRLRACLPGVRIVLLSTNAYLDLGRIEADITVRPAVRLPPELVGERAGQIGFALYRAAGTGEGAGWLALEGPLARSRPGQWMAEALKDVRMVAGADSFLTLREMVLNGMGQAILPSFLVEGDARFEPVEGVYPPQSTDLWVASHADLARAPRIVLVARKLAAMLAGAGVTP